MGSGEEAGLGSSLTRSASYGEEPWAGGAWRTTTHVGDKGDMVSYVQQEAQVSLVLGSHGQRNQQEGLLDTCKSAPRENEPETASQRPQCVCVGGGVTTLAAKKHCAL